MFDTSDDSKPRRPRRVEVFTGSERCRDWLDERKIAIVSESLEPGVNVSELARRHEPAAIRLAQEVPRRCRGADRGAVGSACVLRTDPCRAPRRTPGSGGC